MQKTKLIKKEAVAAETTAFYFEKPTGFEFRAGQYITCSLPGSDSHDFSIASAPSDDHLMIATRMRDSAFKSSLKNMEAGSNIILDGPFGSFVLPNDTSRPVVMLAGGIGVTAFLSMIKEALHTDLKHQMYLFHSNQRQTDTPFLEIFKNLQVSSRNFTYIPTLTQESWPGETGRIDAEMLMRHVINIQTEPKYAPVFLLAGSPPLVSGMFKMLKDLGIDTDYIRTDEFAGY